MFVEFNNRSFNLGRIVSISKVEGGTKTSIRFKQGGIYKYLSYNDNTSLDDIFTSICETDIFPLVKFKNQILNADNIRHIKYEKGSLYCFVDVDEQIYMTFNNCTKDDQRELQRLMNEAMGYAPKHRQIIATSTKQQSLTG